jgi:uncharacterized protein (DUF1778 family)
MTWDKTYDEIEREYAEIRRQHKEFEGLVPVKAKVSKNLGIVYSVRFTPEDLDAIEEAAKAQGMKLSEFIRKAALGAAAGGDQVEAGEKAQALEEVREKVRELEKAVRRL